MSATKDFLGSSILHECAEDSECFCVYEDTCTGQFSRRLIRVPVWLDVILRPRHAYRVLHARWRIANRLRGES